MANILKQQDLLKGLPDARLVMLAQNPTGDIPLFLIAAEMNRREEIRGQYAPDANEESVVDTLTKQIARVPQNLQSSPQMPPMVPPTPPMAGVAALEQQMAMEQAAQNAVQQQQPQMMRAGGQVRRFQSGGLMPVPAPDGVSMLPKVPLASSRVKEIARELGITVEQAAQMVANGPSIGPPPSNFASQPLDIELPPLPSAEDDANAELTFRDQFNRGLGKTLDWASDPLGWQEWMLGDKYMEPSEYFQITPENIQENRNKVAAAEEAKKLGEYYTMNRLDTEAGLRKINDPAATTKEKMAEDKRIKNQYQQYADSRKQVPEKDPEETEDEYRARLQALFEDREPDDWTKAQRWFAMAEQFLDPSKTNMQSIAGAGRAFAEQSAAINAAERQAKIDMEKALLEYDIGDRDYKRSQSSALAEEQRQTLRFFAEQSRANIEAASEQLKNIARQRADYIKAKQESRMGVDVEIDPAKDPQLAEFDRQARDLMDMINKFRGQHLNALKGLGAATGTDPSITVFTGDSLETFGK